MRHARVGAGADPDPRSGGPVPTKGGWGAEIWDPVREPQRTHLHDATPALPSSSYERSPASERMARVSPLRPLQLIRPLGVAPVHKRHWSFVKMASISDRVSGRCKRRGAAGPGRRRQCQTRYQQVGKGSAADDAYDGRGSRLRARSAVEVLSRGSRAEGNSAGR